jgi:pimeloyl-ACP methyl ester carboxylesterase
MKTSWLRITLIAISLLVIIYYLGPRPATPSYKPELPSVPQDPALLEHYVAAKESGHVLKPDNEARIVWADSLHHKTPYAIVYLHGFSASQKEGDPVHRDLAKRYGCNLYLSRLDGHGIDTSEPLRTMTATGLWNDAKEAIAIGKALGDKVIVVSTSTGGTLALELAANCPADVYALINMSPNIEINNNLAFLANNPWGLQLARMVSHGDYHNTGDTSSVTAPYWYHSYRLEAVSELQNLMETTMLQSTFSKVRQPVLDLYYYKDKIHQDSTVRVSAILRMHNQLGTPDNLKEKVDITGSRGHVLGCGLISGDVPGVEKAIFEFAESKLHLVPKDSL